MRIGVTIVIGLILLSSGHAAFRADLVPVKDRYTNYDYAYSVRLPKGLTGLQSPAPFPNHGFVIELADDAKASLSVSASYNAAEWNSFTDAIIAHKSYFKREVGSEIDVVAKAPAVLGGLRAIHFTMKPRTSPSSDPEVRDVLVAFREVPGEVGFVYEIVLRTQTSRYPKDKHRLTDLQRSWRLRPLPK